MRTFMSTICSIVCRVSLIAVFATLFIDSASAVGRAESPLPVEEDVPFVKVEKMPKFMEGDLMTFRRWVQENLHYPQSAREEGISSRVLLTFIIERDGTLTGIEVLQSPDRLLSDEAVRVVGSSPKWTPGEQRGQAVRVKYTLPVDLRPSPEDISAYSD